MNRVVQTLIASAASVTLVAALAVAEGGGDPDDRYVAVFWGKSAPAGTTVALKGDRRAVAKLVIAEASRQNVPHRVALAVAKIESGFRCEAVGPKTRHGRAMGPLQILPGSAAALGYPTTSLDSCGNGLAAGMAHLARCRQVAGDDPPAISRCHVQGWARDPRKSVNRYAERYVQSFRLAYASMQP